MNGDQLADLLLYQLRFRRALPLPASPRESCRYCGITPSWQDAMGNGAALKRQHSRPSSTLHRNGPHVGPDVVLVRKRHISATDRDRVVVQALCTLAEVKQDRRLGARQQ